MFVIIVFVFLYLNLLVLPIGGQVSSDANLSPFSASYGTETREDITERFARMENLLQEQNKKIRILDEKVEAQQQQILRLKETIAKSCENYHRCCLIPDSLANISNNSKGDTSEGSENKLDQINAPFVTDVSRCKNVSNIGLSLHTASSSRRKKAINGEQVAFSTYLDHYVRLDVGTTIKCNQVLVDDGGGYNKYTGVYTIPTGGTYFFTYSVCLHHTAVSVRLMFDGKTISSLEADAIEWGRSGMSSNSVIIHANVGQVLWMELFFRTDVTLVSTDEWRCVTFTGFKLY